MRRIFLIIICLFFIRNVFAEEGYLSELKGFIVAFKPAVDIEKELSELHFDKSTENEIEFRAAMNKCVLQDIDKFYEKMIPIFQRHYSISELKKLSLSLQSKAGIIYLEYIAGIIVNGSLTQEQVVAINKIGNTKEILKLEPFSADLSSNAQEFALPFRKFCLDKYFYEK